MFSMQSRNDKPSMILPRQTPYFLAHRRAVALRPACGCLALQKSGWVGPSTIKGADFTIQLDEIDLDGYCIAIHRRGRIVAVLAEAEGGRVKAQLFHPPCARTIETLIRAHLGVVLCQIIRR